MVTSERPWLKLIHVRPLFGLTYTPRSDPAYKIAGLDGSTRMALNGTSGNPGPISFQEVPPFDVTNTCEVPYPPNTTYTLSSFVGLIAKSITNRSGKLFLMLVNV